MNFLKTGIKKWIVFLFLCVIPFMTASGVRAFELDHIMSYAFPSNLTVSPKGDVVAWIFNQEGKRNIWIAKGPEYQARQLTRYMKDDGQELSGLAFDASGTIIFYTRGGSANRAGEYPNPTSDPEGVEQAVWAIDIEEGKSWKIGKGSGAVPSPAGNKVLFEKGGSIFLSSSEPDAKPDLLFKARGQNSSPAWSPDASQVAFVSSREDHSFIGVYSFPTNTIEWMSPSIERDAYPVWSPCGEYIAFIRYPALSFRWYGRGGVTFSIMVADVSSGKAWAIWECPNSTGGFAQNYPAQTLRWAANGHLVFYSEHEQWMHLYSINVKEKQLIPLTSGKYEVEDSFLSLDGETMVYNSNSGDIDRRHLWMVSVNGKNTELLTSGKGIEWAPVLTSESNCLVFLCSSAKQPAAPAVMNLEDKSRKLVTPELISEEFPVNDLVVPEKVVFKAPDGLEIHGQLFLPSEADQKEKMPAVIFMHGGPIRQMLLGWHMRGYYHKAYALNQYLAHNGYVVLSVNYRSGIGYGFDFRNAPNQGPRGASEYQDIVAAGRYLQKHEAVDPDKIGLWGGSYGGYLTALGLARDSELFAAGVDLHGVHDWSLRGERRNGGGWGITGERMMSSAYQSSPVADVNFWTSPVLFIHGDDDRNVDFIQTIDMANRLQNIGKAPIELMIIPDEVHGFLRHDIWLKVYNAAADFFNRHLKNEK